MQSFSEPLVCLLCCESLEEDTVYSFPSLFDHRCLFMDYTWGQSFGF